MPDIDASITANIGKNPLAGLGQVAETMNALNQNKLFIGRQAAGAALQQSIDPNTGQIDFARANALIASNPRIAPYAQEAMGEMLAQQGQQIGNKKAGAELAGVYSGLIRQDLSAVTTPQQAVAAVARGVAAGRYPRAFAADFLGGSDIGALMKESAVASGSEAAMEAQFGQATTIQTGGADVAAVANRVTGERNVMGGDAGVVAKTLTPEELASRVTIIGPDQQSQSVPQSELITPTGHAKVSSLTGPHGEVDTDLAPGVKEAAGGSATLLTAARGDVAASSGRILQLHKADDALANAQTGHGAQSLQDLRSVLVTMGIAPQGEADKVKNFDEANKYLTAYALNQAAALGSGTDAKLAAAMTSNASTKISNLAARDVVKVSIGLEKMKQAQLSAFDASGLGPGQYAQWSSEWAKNVDPRAFLVDSMTKEQRTTMLKGMSAGEQKKFLASLRTAVSTGVVDISGIK